MPSPADVANVPPVLEYLRSVTTLAPFMAGVGIGWTVGVYFKKERIDVLEQAKDFLSKRIESMAKENESLLAELRETRSRTDALTELLHEERKATTQFMAEHSRKHTHCSICGGPLKRVGEDDRSGYRSVTLSCDSCKQDFRVAASTLASRI